MSVCKKAYVVELKSGPFSLQINQQQEEYFRAFYKHFIYIPLDIRRVSAGNPAGGIRVLPPGFLLEMTTQGRRGKINLSLGSLYKR